MAELKLRYNALEDRFGVWDCEAGDWYIEGLHCGMTFDALHGGAWVPVRIEMDGDGWYLVGLPLTVSLQALEVRFRG